MNFNKQIKVILTIFMLTLTITGCTIANTSEDINASDETTEVIEESNKPINKRDEYVKEYKGEQMKAYQIKNLLNEYSSTNQEQAYFLKVGSSDCNACKATVDDIVEFNKNNETIKVYSLIVDKNDDELKKIIKDTNLNHKYMISNEGIKVDFLRDYNIEFSPTLFLVSKENTIEDIIIGEFNQKDLNIMVNVLTLNQ